jgi:hypothetical protein
MGDTFHFKALSVKEKIEHDLIRLSMSDIYVFFCTSYAGRRETSFVKYYNRTVLDKEPIKFASFKHQWAIQGMTREVYSSFDENFYELKKEIEEQKDIYSFFEKYCCRVRREGAFCAKLFHTILPSQFPPVDNPIRKRFGLQNETFIDSVMIIKEGYELFILANPGVIRLIRNVLSSHSEFSFLRVNELSDIRLLDLFYWAKESRKKSEKELNKKLKP